MNRTKHKIDKNEISEIVHGCAKGLYRAGFIDKTRMDKYDVMCFKTKTKYTPKRPSVRERAFCRHLIVVFVTLQVKF